MRRKELASQDEQLWQELCAACGEGILSLNTADGYPRALAVNYAAHDGPAGRVLYFHGALAGEKHDLIQGNGRVGFSLIQPLAFLPSHWFSADSACPATQLFRSIEIKGRCRLVDDLQEKALGLQLLMERYQPEGGFPPLAPDHPAYAQMLRKTGVFRLEVGSWTGKVKLMQSASPAAFARVLAHLEERGTAVDLLTAQLMRRHRPQDRGPDLAQA